MVPIGIATDGRWVLESGDPERLADHRPRPAARASTASAPPVALTRDSDATDLVVTEPSQPPRTLGEVDVVFPLLHGPWGEDGTIQGMFEMAGVRYVGAGVLASAVSMDKAYMKIVLAAAGLPVLPSVTITPREWAADAQACRDRAAALGYPLFVKPARGGSSIGISKAHDPSELDACHRGGAPHDPQGARRGRPPRARARSSAACSRRSTATPETSVPAEIRIGGEHEFYDFAAKYLPEEHTQLDVPADLPGRRRRGAPRARGPGVRGGRLRGAGPRRLLRDARRVAGRQRDQHDAGLHPDLDVPADVGGHRASTTRRWWTG